MSELLEGSTLRELLRHGALPIRKAIDYGVQIAHGLAAAHDKGIVHRDLKPENLFVTKEGRVKILDFGLAKLTQRQSESADGARTLTAGTDPGLIMGTAGYMSPEQVRGQPVDHRTDIFALGAILYEMLAGKRAFQRSTSAETMTAILNDEPPSISQMVQTAPPGLQRVTHRCLEKNPERRFQSASDLAFALEALSDSGSAPAAALPQGLRSRWLWAAAAGLAAVLIAALIMRWRMPPAVPVVESVTQLTDDGNPKNLDRPLVSDGSRIYFNEMRGSSEVLAQVSATGGQTGTLVSGSESPMLGDLAPDSSSLLLANAHRQNWFLLPLPSGEPRRLPELDGFFRASFSPSGNFYLSKGRSLYVEDKDGSDSRKLFDFQVLVDRVVLSPDGQKIRVTLWTSFAGRSLWEVNADGSGAHPLFPDWQSGADICCGRWTADRRYFVFQSRLQGRADLWALPEGKSWLGRSPLPLRLTNGPLSYEQPFPSRDGKHIYALGLKKRGELVRYDSESRQFVPYLSGISATDATVSSDGKWIAYQSYPDHNLWRVRADGSERLQLTYPPTTVYLPHISPDGSRVAYSDGNTRSIYVVPVEGGIPRKINDRAIIACWSPDSNSLALFVPNTTNQGFGETETIDLQTGKISLVPDSAGTVGAFWPSQDLLVALNIKDAVQGFVTFDFKTKKWSHLVSGPYHSLDAVGGRQIPLLHDRRRRSHGSARALLRRQGGGDRGPEKFSSSGGRGRRLLGGCYC